MMRHSGAVGSRGDGRSGGPAVVLVSAASWGAFRRLAVALLVLLTIATGAATTAFAQGLADVARQEEARRRAVKSPARVFTNDSLRGESAPPSASAPAVAPAPAAPAADAPASTPDTPSTPTVPAAGAGRDSQPPAAEAGGERTTEKYWRTRVSTARDGLDRSQTFLEALQARVNALATDFVNRDDPAQRSRVAAERDKALAELDRVKRDIEQFQKDLSAIEEDARRAGVPAGWVR